MAYQRAYWPTKTIKLGQGYGNRSSSHKYSYAMDLSGNYKVFAPFDCKVTKVYKPIDTKKSREVWLTSTKKVLCANGYYGFLTMSITHPADIINLRVGQKFQQFQDLEISTSIMTGTNNGRHAHIELSKGTEAGWDEKIIKKYGEYVNVNKVKPEEYLFVIDDGKILDNEYKGTYYKFIKEKNITYQIYNVPSEPLIIRSRPLIGKKIGTLYNGNEVLKFNDKAYIYRCEVLGYVPKKYLKKLG